jgi:hypothetical protein
MERMTTTLSSPVSSLPSVYTLCTLGMSSLPSSSLFASSSSSSPPPHVTLALLPEHYQSHQVTFSAPIKNNIIDNSMFVRIGLQLHTLLFTSICLYTQWQLNTLHTKTNHQTKYKCEWMTSQRNKRIVQQLTDIEHDLLQQYIPSSSDKRPQYKLSEQLQHHCFWACSHATTTSTTSSTPLLFSRMHPFPVLLKISGIWETNQEYGLTYKFIAIS